MTSAGTEAFARVYEENFSAIYNYIYAQILQKETAEDLTSDVFLRALSHYESYDSARAKERTWLFAIARNRVIDHFRSGKRSVSLEDVAEPSTSFEEQYKLLTDDPQREVYRLLSMLERKDRELVALRYLNGMKVNDIAAMLGVSAAAVSKRMTRILDKLRQIAEE